MTTSGADPSSRTGKSITTPFLTTTPPRRSPPWTYSGAGPRRSGRAYTDGLIPIHWFVESPGHAKIERMPFQYSIPPLRMSGPLDDFLTFYSWPVNARSGDPLNWLTLPVVDKAWNSKRAGKGGFIQEATGWKPAILQPFVFLPSLLSRRAAP